MALFDPSEGRWINDRIREIAVDRKDERFARLGELQREGMKSRRPLFYGWWYVREYTPQELASAELFLAKIARVFEPTGEECGTVYDETVACGVCGAGERQVSVLKLDLRKVPRKVDIARTIGGELVVSQRLADLILENQLKGCELLPVQHKTWTEDDAIEFHLYPAGRRILQRAQELGVPLNTWEFWVWVNRDPQRALIERMRSEHDAKEKRRVKRLGVEKLPPLYQLRVTGKQVSVDRHTVVGEGPFDEDPTWRRSCPLGHTIGLNLLSELWIRRDSYDGSDFAATNERFGARRGLLRPKPLLLVSPQARQTFMANDIKGIAYEVAHVS